MRVPDVPVIVSVNVPLAAELLVAIANVADPPAVTGFGLNWAVTPDGNPVTLSPTLPPNPPTAVVETV